jgi:hypothetical protein
MRHALTLADLGVIRKSSNARDQIRALRVGENLLNCARVSESGRNRPDSIADASARKFPSTTDRDGRRGYANRREER